jgi:hypothetical protein
LHEPAGWCGFAAACGAGYGKQFKEFPSARAQLKTLADRKVTLMACPGCLKAAGKTVADCAPGIQLADKKAFFSFSPRAGF